MIQNMNPSESVLLAVNGSLMTNLPLNQNMLDANATFVKEAVTEPCYRMFSINDVHPAMLRVAAGGTNIAVEVWSVPPPGLASILLKEPPGLCVGKVRLNDGEEVLGVLGENILCENRREITEFGGWKAYLKGK